jgi:hypothetical protein
MRLFAIAGAACVLFGAGAQAQTPALMMDYSVAEMRAVLTEVGATINREDITTTGDRYISATDASGLKFGVYAYECDSKEIAQRCRGADYVVSFSIKPGKLAEALKIVSYAAVADYEVEDNGLQMSRYVIFDGGISRANLVTNTEVFLDLTNEGWDALDAAKLLD